MGRHILLTLHFKAIIGHQCQVHSWSADVSLWSLFVPTLRQESLGCLWSSDKWLWRKQLFHHARVTFFHQCCYAQPVFVSFCLIMKWYRYYLWIWDGFSPLPLWGPAGTGLKYMCAVTRNMSTWIFCGSKCWRDGLQDSVRGFTQLALTWIISLLLLSVQEERSLGELLSSLSSKGIFFREEGSVLDMETCILGKVTNKHWNLCSNVLRPNGGSCQGWLSNDFQWALGVYQQGEWMIASVSDLGYHSVYCE